VREAFAFHSTPTGELTGCNSVISTATLRPQPRHPTPGAFHEPTVHINYYNNNNNSIINININTFVYTLKNKIFIKSFLWCGNLLLSTHWNYFVETRNYLKKLLISIIATSNINIPIEIGNSNNSILYFIVK
jgi:dihydroorotate dehydrogenase